MKPLAFIWIVEDASSYEFFRHIGARTAGGYLGQVYRYAHQLADAGVPAARVRQLIERGLRKGRRLRGLANSGAVP